MQKRIYFDMDGTIAGLFYVKGWKEAIDKEDATPYRDAAPLFKADAMRDAIERLQSMGYTIGIISYTGYNSSKDFAKETRRVKREWLKKNFPYAVEIHIIDHNTPKWKAAKVHNAILVDDARSNREAWKWGETINAYRADIVAELNKIGE